MDEDFSYGVIVGLAIGVLAGISLGWILCQVFFKAPLASSSVVFDRDKEGRITSIHYTSGVR